MNRITAEGDLLIEKSDNYSDDLPSSIIEEMDENRILDTTYGVFKISDEDEIIRIIPTYKLANMNLNNYEKVDTMQIELIKHGSVLYYRKSHQGDIGLISSGDKFLVLADDSNPELSVDSDAILGIVNSMRVDLDSTTQEKIDYITGELSDIRKKVYTVKNKDKDFNKILLTQSEIEDMIHNGSLIRIESIN